MAKKASGKKMGGKSMKNENVPAYKPSIWFDGKNIPKGLDKLKPGDTVDLNVKARLIRKSEGIGNDDSVSLEIDSVDTPKRKK